MSIITDAETWLGNEYQKLKTWATAELQAGEQFVETEAHTLVSDGISLLTKIEPALLTHSRAHGPRPSASWRPALRWMRSSKRSSRKPKFSARMWSPP